MFLLVYVVFLIVSQSEYWGVSVNFFLLLFFISFQNNLPIENTIWRPNTMYIIVTVYSVFHFHHFVKLKARHKPNFTFDKNCCGNESSLRSFTFCEDDTAVITIISTNFLTLIGDKGIDSNPVLHGDLIWRPCCLY